MYRHMLVPIDGTELSIEVVSRSVELAHAIGARITFFHARPDYAADSDGALMYSISPEVFMRKSMGESRGFLAKAEASARAAGVSSDVETQVSDQPYRAILDTAEKRNCDLIFMASHGSRGLKGLMVGSQTLKVLASAKIPVLVSAIESNAQTPMLNKAMAILQDEHRSIASVLHGLNYLVGKIRENNTKPDFNLLKAMVSYISTFPEKLHHPKEESYLFPKLREYTHELDYTISALTAQHEEEKRLIKKLEQAFSDYEAGALEGFSSFAELVAQYAEFTWQHMANEEKLFLPAARRYFTEHDWEKIADAFGKNGDPRFGEEMYREFRSKFADITNRDLFPIGAESSPAESHSPSF